MKKLVMLAMIVLMMVAAPAIAKDAGFSWIPNTEADLAGYKIHYGNTSGQYTEFVDCGMPDIGTDGRVGFVLKDVPDGNTFYVATAYDVGGNESDFSNEVSDDAPPAAPGDLVKTVIVNININ